MWEQWLELTQSVVIGCKASVVEEVYANYEIQDMLSTKKAHKVRVKGLEMLIALLVGLLRLRNKKLAQNQ